MAADRHTLVSGLDELFKSVELKLPCVVSVRNFDVHRVVKRLAQALGVQIKFWQTLDGYYSVLYWGRITGTEITRLVEEFNRSDEV
jgi:hypothetical protein